MQRDFDYIICGGGSAGCVLAARLSEAPDISVLLIEAGKRDRHFLYRWPAGFAKMTKGMGAWGYHTTPQRHMRGRVLRFTQAKIIGGGSTINAQLYNRGNALDFDMWRDQYGCAGWGFADVLPYFKRSERNDRFENSYHSGDGPLGVSVPRGALPISDAFLRAAQQMGIPYNSDFNGLEQAGIGYYQLTQKNARRTSSASAFLDPARPRPNLTILEKSAVERIEIENEQAVAVRTIRGKFTINRELIISAGAIGSPLLLMRSGLGPADHLKAGGIAPILDQPGIGENLQDHINLCALAECSGPHSYDGMKRPDRAIMAAIQYLLFNTGPVTSSLFETGGFWYSGKDTPTPDIQFHLGLGSGIEAGIAKIRGHGITLNSAFLKPVSRGSVRLGANGRALIDPNYWAEPGDLNHSLEALRQAREILAQPALKPYLKAEILPGPDCQSRAALFDYACKIAKTDHHPVGTCRMGKDPASVVDPKLRLRGIENLRIVDASIMPEIVSANTNAATFMIAEKAADMILGKDPLPRADIPTPPSNWHP